MKLNKERLKKIIQEELEKELTQEVLGDDDDSALDKATSAQTIADPVVGTTATRVADPNVASRISSTSKLGKGITTGAKGLGPLAAAGAVRSLASNVANPALSGVQRAALVGKDIADVSMGLASTPGAAVAAGRAAGQAGTRAVGALTGPAAGVAGAGFAGYETGKLASKAIGKRLGPESEYAKQAGKGVTDVDWKDAAGSLGRFFTGKKRHTGGTVTPGGSTSIPKVSEGTKSMTSINLIKTLVEQELNELDGGIMDPNMVPFVPHRMPGSDTGNEPEEPREVDHMYSVAVKARLATEALVEALDEPIYDQAYEAAFKATMALRDALNALMALGAKPDNKERIVAPDVAEQPVGAAVGVKHMPMTYTGDTV